MLARHSWAVHTVVETVLASLNGGRHDVPIARKGVVGVAPVSRIAKGSLGQCIARDDRIPKRLLVGHELHQVNLLGRRGLHAEMTRNPRPNVLKAEEIA